MLCIDFGGKPLRTKNNSNGSIYHKIILINTIIHEKQGLFLEGRLSLIHQHKKICTWGHKQVSVGSSDSLEEIMSIPEMEMSRNLHFIKQNERWKSGLELIRTTIYLLDVGYSTVPLFVTRIFKKCLCVPSKVGVTGFLIFYFVAQSL